MKTGQRFSEVNLSPKWHHLGVIQLITEHGSDEHSKFRGSSKGLQACPKCTSCPWKCSPWIVHVPELKQSWKCPWLWEQRCLRHTGPQTWLEISEGINQVLSYHENWLVGKGEKELWGKVDNKSCRVSSVLHWLNSGDYLLNNYGCITEA